MSAYLEAKKYLHEHYKELMSLFSMIYTQLEAEERNLDSLRLAAKAAYYTVVSHVSLSSHPILTLVESFIKGNKEAIFDQFEKELTVCILTESRIHDLEVNGTVKIIRDKSGNTQFFLTNQGKEECVQKGIKLEDLIDFYK